MSLHKIGSSSGVTLPTVDPAKKWYCGDGNWYYRLENLEAADGEEQVSPTTWGKVITYDTITINTWTQIGAATVGTALLIKGTSGWMSGSLTPVTTDTVYHLAHVSAAAFSMRILNGNFEVRVAHTGGQSGVIAVEYIKA